MSNSCRELDTMFANKGAHPSQPVTMRMFFRELAFFNMGIKHLSSSDDLSLCLGPILAASHNIAEPSEVLNTPLSYLTYIPA